MLYVDGWKLALIYFLNYFLQFFFISSNRPKRKEEVENRFRNLCNWSDGFLNVGVTIVSFTTKKKMLLQISAYKKKSNTVMNMIKFNASVFFFSFHKSQESEIKLWNFHVHEIWLHSHARAIYSTKSFYRLKCMQFCHEQRTVKKKNFHYERAIKFVAHVLINLLLKKKMENVLLSARHISRTISLIFSSSLERKEKKKYKRIRASSIIWSEKNCIIIYGFIFA